jgi:surface protein
MQYMFRSAYIATPDTSGWDTSLVTSMKYMFYGAYDANPDTSGWDTSLVTDMQAMFQYAYDANPDTSGWDTSNVTKMAYMFFSNNSNSLANPDVSGWDTSKVTSMRQMFYKGAQCNPDLSNWNFSLVTDYYQMFTDTNIGTTNYDGFLNRLNAQRITYSLTGRNIYTIPSTYTTATSGTARTALLANGWSFTDDGGV